MVKQLRSLPRQHFPAQPPDTNWYVPRAETTSSKQASSTVDPITRGIGLHSWGETVQPMSCLGIELFFLEYNCIYSLLCCHTQDHERESLEYQRSPSKPRLHCATGAPVTWNSCVRLLYPALLFSSRNRSAEQPTVHNTPLQLWLESHVFHIVLCPSEMVSLSFSLFPAEHLPSVDHTREETVRAREGWAWWAFCLLLLLSPLHFLTCVIVVHSVSFLLTSCRFPVTLICQSCPAFLCHPRT